LRIAHRPNTITALLPRLRRRAADPAQVDTVMARVRAARNEPPLIPEKNG
jgi:hypothetical protein